MTIVRVWSLTITTDKGKSQTLFGRHSDNQIIKSRQYQTVQQLLQRRPWLQLVADHPNFPRQPLRPSPLTDSYWRAWEHYARGLSWRAPAKYSQFLLSGQQRLVHWRWAWLGKAVLVGRYFWRQRQR